MDSLFEKFVNYIYKKDGEHYFDSMLVESEDNNDVVFTEEEKQVIKSLIKPE